MGGSVRVLQLCKTWIGLVWRGKRFTARDLDTAVAMSSFWDGE